MLALVMETIVIVAYMFNGTAGMILMLISSVIVMLTKKYHGYEKIFVLMTLSLPMASIGIAGMNMHHIFSWYNLFLAAFMFKIIFRKNKKFPLSSSAALSLIIILALLLFNIIWATDALKTFTEIAQVFIMLIPLCVIHFCRKTIPMTKNAIEKLVFLYADVCVSTSVGMLIQYSLYRFAGLKIGVINFSGDRRVMSDCLFKGASILPMFLGIGFIVFFINILEKKAFISEMVKCVVIFLAMVLNSSRSALLMVILVLAWLCIKKLMIKPDLKTFFCISIGCVGAVLAINYIITLRSGLNGFLDANGRITTWMDGLRIWTADTKNFLLGEGFSGRRWAEITKPHNFIVQTVAQCGIIISVIVCCMIEKYLLSNRTNRYKYIAWFVLLSGLVVTDFYANAFATVIFMLIDMYGGKSEKVDLPVLGKTQSIQG